MKKTLLLLASAFALFSCTEKEPEPVVEPSLELSKQALSFQADEALETTFTVTSNVNWEAICEDWITVDPSSGEGSPESVTVKVTVQPNDKESPRYGGIVVTAGSLTKTVEISQSGAQATPEPEPSLVLSEEQLSFQAKEALEATFTLTSNVNWEATSDEWITLDPSSGEGSSEAVNIKVTVQPNDQSAKRDGQIVVVAGTITKYIAVSQEYEEAVPEPEMTGTGTEADPYIILTSSHLLSVREKALPDAETYFRLEADIDMTSVDNWVPFNWDSPYSRKIHFDGNNKTISNFAPKTYNDAEDVAAGYPSLFGVLYGSCQNLNVTGAKIEDAKSVAGILAGYVGTTDKPATVKNVYVQGSVSGTKDRIGGMAGVAQDAVFEDCSADVTVKTSSTDAGGFVGKVQGTSSFKGCDAKVILETSALEKNRAGGFIGWNGSVKTTIEDCHVLEGSKVTDISSKSAKANANLGGFIGFGDNKGTVLEIKNCSAKADVDAGAYGVQASAFIGTLSYASTVVIQNSSAEGTVTSAQNYVGGVVAYNGGGAQLTVTGCSFNGTITGASGVGGIVGAAESAPANISKCHVEGTLTTTGHNVGGIVGLVNGVVDIQNCWANVSVNMAKSQFGAGIVGATTQTLTVKNCYALGEINVSRGAGGIVGQVKTQAPSVEGCIAWNSISTNRTAAQYSPGAIVGNIQVNGKFAQCYRKADMLFSDVAMTLVDHEDIENGRPELPVYEEVAADANQSAYHGKAAAADATISSVAKSLGWDETVWDLSGAVPTLK